MKQSTNQQLFAYWDWVRNGRRAPSRLEIEPSHIAELLPQTFIVETEGRSSYRYRLAGTRLCQYFGRELKGTDFCIRWENDHREAIESALECVTRDFAGLTVTFDLVNVYGRSARMEMVALPLLHETHGVNRLLGAITSCEEPVWLGHTDIDRCDLIEIDVLWPDHCPHFMDPPLEEGWLDYVDGDNQAPPVCADDVIFSPDFSVDRSERTDGGAPAPSAPTPEQPEPLPIQSFSSRIIKRDRRCFRVFDGGRQSDDD